MASASSAISQATQSHGLDAGGEQLQIFHDRHATDRVTRIVFVLPTCYISS